MLERLRQEAACAAARIVNRLADLWIDNLDHRLDNLARRGEALAVVVFG